MPCIVRSCDYYQHNPDESNCSVYENPAEECNKMLNHKCWNVNCKHFRLMHHSHTDISAVSNCMLFTDITQCKFFECPDPTHTLPQLHVEFCTNTTCEHHDTDSSVPYCSLFNSAETQSCVDKTTAIPMCCTKDCGHYEEDMEISYWCANNCSMNYDLADCDLNEKIVVEYPQPKLLTLSEFAEKLVEQKPGIKYSGLMLRAKYHTLTGINVKTIPPVYADLYQYKTELKNSAEKLPIPSAPKQELYEMELNIFKSPQTGSEYKVVNSDELLFISYRQCDSHEVRIRIQGAPDVLSKVLEQLGDNKKLWGNVKAGDHISITVPLLQVAEAVADATRAVVKVCVL